MDQSAELQRQTEVTSLPGSSVTPGAEPSLSMAIKTADGWSGLGTFDEKSFVC